MADDLHPSEWVGIVKLNITDHQVGHMRDAFACTTTGVVMGGVNVSEIETPNMTELGRFLASLPPPQAVLEHLAITALRPWNPRAVWLTSPEDSGVFRLDRSFGALDQTAFEANPPDIWGRHVLAEALESERGVLASMGASEQNAIAFTDPAIAHLIACSTYPTARARCVIGVACVDSVDDARGCLKQLEGITPLLAVYLSFLEERRELTADSNRGIKNDGVSALTPRQATVLRLLADNLKNREIAFSIGYSESTVRIETIEIYRKLGVSGRHEAVRVAARLGLLEDTSFDVSAQPIGRRSGR